MDRLEALKRKYEAEAAAIQVVYDYINGQANYWYSVRERFERTFEVD